MAGKARVNELVNHFEQQILSGELAPGDALPSERTIALERGVSRSVVREAISRLASLGLVRSVRGSGTRVEAATGQPITQGYQRLIQQGEIDLAHLAEVRLPLETTIAGLAALHRTDDHLVRMEQTQLVLADPHESLEHHVAADLEFHAVLAEASGNPLFGLVLAPIQQLLIESRRRTLGRHGAHLAFEHHARILQAVREQQQADAVEAMKQHLSVNVQHVSGEKAPTMEVEVVNAPVEDEP